MPQYAALIWSTDLEPSDPRFAEMMPGYNAFGHEAEAVIRGGAALYHNATATTVRVTGGKGGDVVTTDGPVDPRDAEDAAPVEGVRVRHDTGPDRSVGDVLDSLQRQGR